MYYRFSFAAKTLAVIFTSLLLLVALHGTSRADVELTWDANTEDDVTWYRIYRGANQGGPYTQIGEVTHPTVTFTDTTEQSGETYHYVATAVDSLFNESGYSNEIPYTVVPATPGSVAASDGAFADRVAVSWQNVSGETGYRVYRAASAGGSYTQVGSPPANTTNHDDLLACGGTSYYYRISALNSGGESPLSLPAEAGSTAACLPVPPIPGNVSASDGSSLDFVTITWSASTGADDYRVYRSNGVSSTKTANGNWQTGLSYQDTTGTPGTTYYYWVVARNAAGTSDYGGPDAGFRAAPAEVVSNPDRPAGPSSGFATLSYTYAASGGTSSYGHDVQYRFDWRDGTMSSWLPVGTLTASKSWSADGTYAVRVRARCADHPTIESGWSSTFSVSISTDTQAPDAPTNLKMSSL